VLEKKTVLDRIEIDADGHVFMRLQKQIVEDGEVLFSEFHRSVIAPGQTPEAQVASVNSHLVQMGFPEIPAADQARLASHTAAEAQKRAVTLSKLDANSPAKKFAPTMQATETK
jgi:hypothetical protein